MDMHIYIPFVYLNMCLTIIFGGAIGAMVGLGSKWGKVRNHSVYFLAGLLFGLLAEYAGGWIFWVYASSKQKFLLVHPQDIWNVVTEIAATGAWSMFGWTPRGIWLYLIWGIEALIILGCTTLISSSMVASIPFCERCNRWIEDKKSIHPLQIIIDQNEFRVDLEKDDYTMVKALPKIKWNSRSYTQLDLLHCSECQLLFLMTVKTVSLEKDEEGKDNKKEEIILENLIIRRDVYEMLKHQW